MYTVYRGHMHPATMFAALLKEVGFDHELLLDWLISPETRFLTYLTGFLKMVVGDWPGFVVHTVGVAIPPNDEGDEEVVLSGMEAEGVSKVMSCLAGLSSSAGRLQGRGLTPFNLMPLLQRMDRVLELFDECTHDEDEDEVEAS
ncbi:unnamed protein product [Choristocarpus tenellus]